MFSYFARLRAKKGFTLFELIVVIAIIGILTAMVLPNFLYDKRPSMGRAMSKDLYYNLQDVLTSAKIAHPNEIPDGEKVYYYLSITNTGMITASGRIEVSGGSYTTKPYKTDDNDKIIFLDSKVKYALENYTTDKDQMEGMLYVAVDSNYRVCAAYWSNEALSTMQSSTIRESCVLTSGYYLCSYPVKYCETVGLKLFDL